MIDTIIGILMIIFYVSAAAMMLIMIIDVIGTIKENRKFRKELDEQYKRLEEQHKMFVEMLKEEVKNEEAIK